MLIIPKYRNFHYFFNLGGIINIGQCWMFLTSDVLPSFFAFLAYFGHMSSSKKQ